MNSNVPYYRIKIAEKFQELKSKRTTYSLRSFAKYLELHPSTLSRVLNGYRKPPKKIFNQLLEKLHLDEKEYAQFVESYKKDVSLNKVNKIKDTSELIITNTLQKMSFNDSYQKIIKTILMNPSPLSLEELANVAGSTVDNCQEILLDLIKAQLLKVSSARNPEIN